MGILDRVYNIDDLAKIAKRRLPAGLYEFIDGGFKRGADVLKAIAVGASCVMMGRATTFGLAAGGEKGVAKALAILHEETSRALAMLGCTRIDQLSRDLPASRRVAHIWGQMPVRGWMELGLAGKRALVTGWDGHTKSRRLPPC